MAELRFPFLAMCGSLAVEVLVRYHMRHLVDERNEEVVWV